MALYAISDLHLPLGVNKPMDIFGEMWNDYVPRLRENWQKTIKKDDYVVLPGDFSWATYIEESLCDFEFLNNLNGIKILSKGNHDYWWTTMNKLNKFISENNFDNIHFLHNNSYLYKDIAICGNRGWLNPEIDNNNEENERIYNRELARLELSIQSALKQNPSEIVVFTHYPPISRNNLSNQFTELLNKYSIKKCVYGHLHSSAHKNAIDGIVNNIEFSLVSCDYTQFMPIKLFN